MGQFDYTGGRFDERDFPRLVASIANMANHDHDTGWIPVPAGGSVPIQFKTLPRSVEIQTSNSKDGTDWQHETATSVNPSAIAFSTTRAYVRVLANK